MGLTLKEWDHNRRRKYIRAIKALYTWPEFREQYGWTGLNVLKSILEGSENRLGAALSAENAGTGSRSSGG